MHLLDERVAEVVCIVRKPTTRSHPKLTELVIPDILPYDGDCSFIQAVDAICFCIAVYSGAMAAADLRKINVDIPMAYGRLLQEHLPMATFCMLSGQGADPTEKSRIQFARDKGAAENGLREMGLGAFYSFRPGYIYPVSKRAAPKLTYKISRLPYPVLRHMGSNLSIKSTALASAMLNVAIAGA